MIIQGRQVDRLDLHNASIDRSNLPEAGPAPR
jgi:hypothetical protein